MRDRRFLRLSEKPISPLRQRMIDDMIYRHELLKVTE